MLRMNWLGTSEPSSHPGIGTANPADLSGWIDNHNMRLRQQLENDTPQGFKQENQI